MIKVSIIRKTIIVMVISVLIYVIFIALSDFQTVYEKIMNFQIVFTPVILSLALLATFLRSIRYHLYLKSVEINLNFKQSFMIYFAGLSMELTPVRTGQIISSYILKQKYNEPISKSAPVIASERITDLSGLIIISIPSIFFIGQISWIILLATLLLFAIIITTQKRDLLKWLVKIFSRFKKLQNTLNYIEKLYESIHLLMRPKILIKSSIISAVAWLVEGIGIFMVLKALNIQIGIFESILVYTKSAFIGGISFVPSGIGVADGTFVSFLLTYGIEFSIATAAVILARFHFMWFRLVLGFIFLKIVFPKITDNQLE